MQPVTTITITLEQNGNVNMQGPIQDKILCYGLIEAAREAISAWHAAQPKHGLALAKSIPPLNGSGIG